MPPVIGSGGGGGGDEDEDEDEDDDDDEVCHPICLKLFRTLCSGCCWSEDAEILFIW